VERLIFRGARVRYFDGRDSKAGFFTRIYMTADFSDVVREAMGWGPPAEGFSQGKLDGELNATNMVLTPNQKPLRQHELQLAVVKVDDFQFFRVKNSDDETTSEEVRFVLHSAVDGAAGLLENYMRRIGTSDDSVGQLRIAYEVQDELPLTSGSQDGLDGAAVEQPVDGPCVDCNNGVPPAAGDPTMHASNQPCVAYEGRTGDGPPLASAREVAGGTHRKGRKRNGQIGDGPQRVQ
jgi:hypothetical protein